MMSLVLGLKLVWMIYSIARLHSAPNQYPELTL